MAKPRRKTPARKTATRKTRSRRYVCTTCGFKAAHAAGLGRHRTAIHGVVSKRELTQRKAGKGRASGDAQLARRMAALERRYDRLLSGLEQTLRRARSKT